MGIINLHPDSFFAKHRHTNIISAITHVRQMIGDGVDIIDIGAEPTNPQISTPISAQQEMDRLLPVLEILKSEFDIPVSVDTSSPEVMQSVIQFGVSIINDVRALQIEGAVDVVANSDVMVCLMYMGGSKHNTIMHSAKEFLSQRITACEQAGISKHKIIIDPGFGAGIFGKSTAENLQLLNELQQLQSLQLPILVGISRKTFIGDILNAPVEKLLFGGLAATVVAIQNGANIIRTHDVKETIDIVTMITTIMENYKLCEESDVKNT